MKDYVLYKSRVDCKIIKNSLSHKKWEREWERSPWAGGGLTDNPQKSLKKIVKWS